MSHDMKERPILFSAPMVRAILDGRKTQTRRVVKQKHLPWLENSVRNFLDGKWNQRPLPYGKPGDQLWVREAWRIGAWDENRPAFALDYCDGPRKEWIEVPDAMGDDGELFDRLWQQSSDDAAKALGIQDRYQWEPGQSPCRWRPSIHMPRWASRIQLEITGIRVERLQDISEDDAYAEGIKHSEHGGITARDGFQRLWESINGAGSWDTNPWVWCITFRRLKP